MFDPQRALVSSRGQRVLEFNGRTYTFQDKYYRTHLGNWKFRWKCRAYQCGGKAVSVRAEEDGQDMQIQDVPNSHAANCVPNNTDLVRQRAMQQLQQQLRTGQETNRTEAYAKMTAALMNPQIVGPDFVANQEYATFPSAVTCRSKLMRAKRKAVPVLPKTIEQISFEVLDEQFGAMPNTHERFLQFVADFNAKKIICFGTPTFMQLLAENADTVQIDGTFKVVPRIIGGVSAQLLTIHCMDGDLCVPCVYALLPNKSTPCYVTFFEHLRQACAAVNINLVLGSAVVDFESALMAALRQIWPNIILRGCFFHFCSTIWKYIGSIPILRAMYFDKLTCFDQFARSIMALAFLPIDDDYGGTDMIINTYNELCTRYRQQLGIAQFATADMHTFLQYIENQWLNNANIPISMWNVWERHADRTNNNVEGFHNRINLNIGNHKSLSVVCTKLIREQQHYELLRAQLHQGGQQVIRRSNTFVRLQAKIVPTKVAFYNSFYADPLQYVVRVSHFMLVAAWGRTEVGFVNEAVSSSGSSSSSSSGSDSDQSEGSEHEGDDGDDEDEEDDNEL